MDIVYTAPNRGHHYRYATALQEAGMLKKFVSGFSRLSPRSGSHSLGNELQRADWLQTIYMGSLKVGLPSALSDHLAYLAKIEQDWTCGRFISDADIFMFYSGSGLHSCLSIQKQGGVGIVEAVNSHVSFQEDLLQGEYERLKLPWRPFNALEKRRRISEYQQANYILLPSEFVRQSFLKLGFPEEKLLKVPYGFDSYEMPAKLETTNSRYFTVLYVGSISVRKGLRYLIQAFTNFEHPRKRLILVGPKTSHTGLDDVPIPPEVVFAGTLKGGALEQAYQNADVFCLPSIEEGLALVLGEALSFGIPIIATANSGAADIFTDEKEGYIVPIRNSEAIKDKLQYLADNPYMLQQMRETATQKSKKLQGWQQTGKRLVETLRSIPILDKHLRK